MNQRIKSMLIGLAAGALLGATFAWVASANDDPENPDAKVGVAKLGPSDYFQLGISILTIARQFGSMVGK